MFFIFNPAVVLIHLCVGARPNFVKVAPLYEVLCGRGRFEVRIIHTGQHYDYEMSKAFFEDLYIPEPDVYLGVGGGTHAQQTATVMVEYEKVLEQEKPALVVVFGDVNSTLACALTAVKLYIPVAHVEAGLRSGDMSMPEEVNRRLTDAISDLLFTPSEDADDNLLREGVEESKIFRVGNIMIDSLVRVLGAVNVEEVLSRYGVEAGRYVLVTLHRPHNVDNIERLREIVIQLSTIAREVPVLFPVHPRTRRSIGKLMGEEFKKGSLVFLEPLRYREFVALESRAALVITDSGGVQEETTFLGVPCLTVRPNTERPVTITLGTNQLVEPSCIYRVAVRILSGEEQVKGCVPPLWDGHTARRIVPIIEAFLTDGVRRSNIQTENITSVVPLK